MVTRLANEVKVYKSENHRFSIWAQPNRKEYGDNVNRASDRIFVIRCSPYYAFQTEDVCKMIYFLIANKQLRQARKDEIEKLITAIYESLKSSGDYNVPKSLIPVCEYTNCLVCPLYDNGNCTSAGAEIMQTYLKLEESNVDHS